MSTGFPPSDPHKVPPIGGSSIPNPYGGSAPYGGSTYSPGPIGSEPPRKDRTGCIAASVVAVILGGLVLGCGGCGVVGYFLLDADYKEKARQLSVDYRNDPKVIEIVGDVESITYNWGQSLNRGDEAVDVYDIKGDKGTAQLVVEADFDGEPLSVTLQNDRGEWELTGEAMHEHDHAYEEAGHDHK